MFRVIDNTKTHQEKITTVLEIDSPLVKALGHGNMTQIRVSCCGRYFGYYFDDILGMYLPLFLADNEQEAWDRLPYARSCIEELSGLIIPNHYTCDAGVRNHLYTDDARVAIALVDMRSKELRLSEKNRATVKLGEKNSAGNTEIH